jgi:hypothetical protein
MPEKKKAAAAADISKHKTLIISKQKLAPKQHFRIISKPSQSHVSAVITEP